jgi:hypothetical protein
MIFGVANLHPVPREGHLGVHDNLNADWFLLNGLLVLPCQEDHMELDVTDGVSHGH